MSQKHILPAVAFLVFQTSLSVNLLPVFAADDASNAALVDMIRHANIVNPAFKLTAAVSASEALITTECKVKSSESDRKIQAVLIAKTAFESLPGDVQRVKLLLLDYDANDCSTITVKRAEVKLFGTGGLSQKELLDSLEISKTDNAVVATGSTVVDGPEQGERMLVLGRIEKLKSQGANVSGYVTYFKQIEEAAKAADADGVKTKCAYLGEKLADQEACIKQIRTRAVAQTPKAATSLVPHSNTALKSAPITAPPNPAAVKSALRNVLSPNQLAAIDPNTVGVGYRAMAMTNKLSQLQSQGLNTTVAMGQCAYAQMLLTNGDTEKANSVMTNLEQRYGR